MFKEVKKQLDIDGKTELEVLLVTLNNNIICYVPKDPANTDYAEILKQVEAGTLTIKDAD